MSWGLTRDFKESVHIRFNAKAVNPGILAGFAALPAAHPK